MARMPRQDLLLASKWRKPIQAATGCSWVESQSLANPEASRCLREGIDPQVYFETLLIPSVVEKYKARCAQKALAQAAPAPEPVASEMTFADLAAAAKGRVASLSDEWSWVDRHIAVPLDEIELADVPSPGAVWKLQWAKESPGEFAKLWSKQAGGEEGGKGVGTEDRTLIELLEDFKRRVPSESAS